MTYQYAGFWIRFFAHIIDSIIMTGISIFLVAIVVAPFALLGVENEIVISFVVLIVIGILLFVPIIYWAVLEHARGATYGKSALGLKVISTDGKQLTFMQSLGRAVVKWIEYNITILTLIILAVSEKKQSLHDMAAHTYVIHAKSNVAIEPTVPRKAALPKAPRKKKRASR